MKLKDFKKEMQKPIFSLEEAFRVGWKTKPTTLKLQLHHWTKAGDLTRLKKGLYAFPEKVGDKIEIARALYAPAYVSLEYALNLHGLLPDVVFAITLVTPKTTREFTTPLGLFIYHHIQFNLFWGFDPETLFGEKEKVLVDYCYLYSGRLIPKTDFWETFRWQNLKEVDFDKATDYAKKFGVKKVLQLIESLATFGEYHGKT